MQVVRCQPMPMSIWKIQSLWKKFDAHAGIDIGQTLIGMHLKAVAIPLRTSIEKIGDAVVTIATTRPKLIGGERAIYY